MGRWPERQPVRIKEREEIVEVPVGEGRFAVVDIEFLLDVKDRSWHLDNSGNPVTNMPRLDFPRLSRKVQLRSIILSTRAKKGYRIENIDGDRLNCRLGNLRQTPLADPSRPKQKPPRPTELLYVRVLIVGHDHDAGDLDHILGVLRDIMEGVDSTRARQGIVEGYVERQYLEGLQNSPIVSSVQLL